MERATEFSDIPQLAGVKGAFDLAQEFGIDAKVVMAWDITTQLAVLRFTRTTGCRNSTYTSGASR